MTTWSELNMTVMIMNGTVPDQNYGYIDDNNLELYVSGSGQGLRIYLTAGNLELDPTHIYEIRIEGTLKTDNTLGSGPLLRFQAEGGGTSIVLGEAQITKEVGSSFALTASTATSMTGTPVTNLGNYLRITVSSAAVGMTFNITTIDIEDKGAKAVEPVQVSFNTNGGDPATINPITVNKGMPAGGDFPADPTKTGFIFTGWYDETATPPKKYDSTTPIPDQLTLTANWADENEGSEGVVFSLADWIADHPTVTTLTTSTTSAAHRPLNITSSGCTNTVSSSGIEILLASSGNGLRIQLGAGDVELNPAHKYEVRIEGSVVSGSASGAQLRLVPGANTSANLAQINLPATGDAFTMTASTITTFDGTSVPELGTFLRIHPSSAAVGYTIFITSIEIEDMGLK